MDRDKSKPPSKISPTRDASASIALRGPFARTEINAIIANQGGPVTNGSDARKWLNTKGWIIDGEQFDRSKIVNILLTVSLLPRIPPEAINAIRAVAFILDDDIIDNLSSSLAAAVAEKVNAGLTEITKNLERSASFLEANSVQQAATTLDLKQAAAKPANSLNDLNHIVNKLSSAVESISSISHWPPPPPCHPSLPSLPSPTYNPNTPDNLTKLKHRLLQSACTVLIVTDPAAPTNTPDHKTPPGTDTQDLRTKLNQHLEELDNNDRPLLDFLEDEPDNSPNNNKTIVKGIQVRKNGGFLLDFDTPESAERFISYSSSHIFLLAAHFGDSAVIKPRGFPVLMKFVPCTGEFNPKDPNHIFELEANSKLKKGAITAANWLKRPDRRSPHQQVATLKITCADPQSANQLLRNKIFVQGHAVTVMKDIHEPIRCNNCQEFGHIRANCPNDEVCAQCCSTAHKTADCPPNQTPHCRSCGPSSSHPSYSRNCPVFADKCASLDERFPENNMPYFPTGEDWTWAMSPPKPSSLAATHTLPQRNRPPPPAKRQANLSDFIKEPKSSKAKLHASLPDRPTPLQPSPNV